MFIVVDDIIGPELSYQIELSGRAGGDDGGPQILRHLNHPTARAARRGGDKDPLSCFDGIGLMHERPGRHSLEGHSGGRARRQTFQNAHRSGGRNGHVACVGG